MPDLKMANRGSTLPPCMGCGDREEGCHSSCKAYSEWAKAEKIKRDDVRRKKNVELMKDEYVKVSRRKMKRRRRTK